MPIIGITGDSSYQSYRGTYDNVPLNVDFGDLENIYPQFVYASTPQKIEGINAKTEIRVNSGEAKVLVYYDEDEFDFETSEDGSSYYQYIGLTTTNTLIRPGANIILFIEATSNGNPITENLFNQIYSNNISIGKLDFSWTVTTSSIPSAVGLQFPVVINAPLSSQIISSSYTVSGLLSDVSYVARIISDEGRIRVNSGGNVTNSIVVNGDIIQLVLPQTASTQLTSKQISISISAQNGAGLAQTTWSVTTENINSASNLSFTPATNVGFGTTVISSSYTVSGLTSNTTYTGEIVGSTGLFNVNSGVNTTRSTVNNNDVIRLFLPQTPLTELTTTPVVFRVFQALDVGDTSTTWNVTTKAINRNITFTPSDFTDDLNVNIDTFVTSNEITLSGIDTNISLPVTTNNADYKLKRGSTIIKDFNQPAINVINGDIVSLRAKSSPSYVTETTSSLTVGNTSADWKLRTISQPFITFNPLDFTDVSNANINQTYTSNQITITGLNSVLSNIPTITGGEYRVIRSGSVIKDYTASDVSLQNNDVIQLRTSASSSYKTSKDVTFSVGGSSIDWRITTKPSPPIFSPSSYQNVSNATINTTYTTSYGISVSNLDSSISYFASVSGGSYQIIRGGSIIKSFDSTSNPQLQNGDSISLRRVSSSSYNSTSSVFLSVGDTSTFWSITTGSAPVLTGNISVTHIITDVEPDINKFLYYSGTPINRVTAVLSGSSRYYSISFTNSITTFNQSSITFSKTGAEGGSQPSLRIKSLVRNSSTLYTLRFERVRDDGVWIETFCRSFDFSVQYQS